MANTLAATLGSVFAISIFVSGTLNLKIATSYRIYPAIRRGIWPSRMTSNK